MKTNVTCSLDTRLVAALDAWRAPMCVGRSKALELLLESIAEGAEVESTEGVYFDSNGEAVSPGIHHDNTEHDMVIPGREVADTEPPSSEPLVGADPEVEADPDVSAPSAGVGVQGSKKPRHS
jgi:hypothetical protein